MNPGRNPAGRAGRRQWIGLAVISLACVLYVMDLTVLHLAVPAISADLRPSSTQLLWISAAFTAGIAILVATKLRHIHATPHDTVDTIETLGTADTQDRETLTPELCRV